MRTLSALLAIFLGPVSMAVAGGIIGLSEVLGLIPS